MTFDEVRAAYEEQVRGLIDGGVDILLLETIFDTLNAKAALVAIENVFEEHGRPAAADDLGDHHRPQRPHAVGPDARRVLPLDPPREAVQRRHQLRARRPRHAPVHRGAGAPGRVLRQQLPERRPARTRSASTTSSRRRPARCCATSRVSGFVNIVGGCCGTTPDHIAAIAAAVDGVTPEAVAAGQLAEPDSATPDSRSRLTTPASPASKPLVIRPDTNFQMIGERTNVTGSREVRPADQGRELHARPSRVAAEQVRSGANLIDVNMDEGMLDSEQAMTTFLNYIATEPEIARVPVMIDSSKWSVLEAGLKCVQGKSRRQLDQPQGRGGGLPREGDAPSSATAPASSSWRSTRPGRPTPSSARSRSASAPTSCSSSRSGFDPTDIIFDPNILAIATGLEEHNDYAMNFIEATRIIKATCPGVKISGGVSNLSFSFRGNDVVREAIHSAFLYHAIKAGMDMGIVNAGQLVVYEDIPKDLLEHVEDIIFNRRPDATERMVQFADTVKGSGQEEGARSRVARAAGREAARLRARPRRRRLHRGGRRGGAPEVRAAARDHRRSADGRDEDRRRPVRRRQDVPAAGREVRARDEEGRRLPAAVHGGGERPSGDRRRPGRRRPNARPQDPHGDRQGGRPRHRQEHRRRRAAVQQLRGHRPRRDGAGGEDPRRGDRRRRSTSSACAG